MKGGKIGGSSQLYGTQYLFVKIALLGELTNKQTQLAKTIDHWVKTIEQAGGGDTQLLEKAYMHMTTFKQLLDISTPEQMNFMCETYPGFYRFANLLEKLAQGIQDGTISIPPAN